MKLVVTGASGFLGRELLRQALETGISEVVWVKSLFSQ